MRMEKRVGMVMKQRHRDQVVAVTGAVLGVVAAVGIVAAVAVAPGVALVFKSFARRYPSRQQYDVDRADRKSVV